jgi:hypothetical protein
MELYNPEVKEAFLSDYPDATKDVFRNIFKKTAIEEERVKSDLYNFNIEEIKRTMYELRPQTLNSAESQGRVITKYISWAIKKGFRSNNINPLITIETNFYKQFLTNIQLHYSEEEIIALEDQLVNYQDKIIIRAIFEGINGYESSELLNLKKGDWEKGSNIVTLHDDMNGERTIKIENPRFWDFIRGALSRGDYFNKNGTVKGNIRKKQPLAENDYVVRSNLTNVKDQQVRVAQSVIFNRLRMVKKVFKDYYALSPKKIEQSGMIKMARDLYVRDGELEVKQYREIAERFGRVKASKGYFYPQELKKYVNMEVIKELYPEI